ncbi:MAG: ribosome biogenesis GTPase Der [Deltaproteobacteria bacterium]|nr:ribosome biogenesis GTPase Der [Deltaproteobacteria bacterium]
MQPSENMPLVAIVGRPNVGKSTLFNRLSRARRAIVDNQPGVTRDRNYNQVAWRRHRFMLVDTGGLEPDERDGLKGRILQQTLTAVDEADVIVFLLDGRTGPTPLDTGAAELLRQTPKPVFYAVNKLDTGPRESDLYDFYRLGVERLFPLSAEHGLGVADLMQEVVDALPRDREGDRESPEPLALAVVGRPNVGKSTLVNRLVGYDRSLVDSRPGTTRDALQADFTWRGTPCRLTDTAGIRRKARVVDPVERYSVSRALRSVDAGDVVIHLLDGSEGVTDQDAQVMSYGFQRGKAMVLGINKWDLLDTDRLSLQVYQDFLHRRLPFADHVPIVSLSALEGSGMKRLMDMVVRVGDAQRRWIKTPALNRALRRLTERHSPSQLRGRAVKFYYGTQTDVQPPTFTLFVNYPEGIGAGYRRYLVKALRAELGLDHTPLRLTLRPRAGRGKQQDAG